MPIDAVHRAGLPHKGVWLHVLSADDHLLLVKRAPSMVTCPSLWSIIGEHHFMREEDDAAAARGVREELPGLAPLRRTGKLTLKPLRERPRWFLFDYPLRPAGSSRSGSGGGDEAARRDRCLVSEYLSLIHISEPTRPY